MVRLKRDIEGLNLDSDRQPPIYLTDPELRPILDATYLEALSTFEWEEGGRVMTIGVGEDVIEHLAQRAKHLSIVEPNDDRRKEISEALGSAIDPMRVTYHAKPYGEISFESNSFDLIVSFDDWNRYADPVSVARKCGRELRIGGRLFSSVTILPTSGREGWIERSRPWALDLELLKEGVEGGLAIDEVRRLHVVNQTMAAMTTRLPAGLKKKAMKALPSVRRVAGAAEAKARSPHTCVAILSGSKALGLGKVFRPGQP